MTIRYCSVAELGRQRTVVRANRRHVEGSREGDDAPDWLAIIPFEGGVPDAVAKTARVVHKTYAEDATKQFAQDRPNLRSRVLRARQASDQEPAGPGD